MMSSDKKVKKLLLMGRSGAGKTSMHSIIFANYPAKETMGIGFTVDINESKFRFMGNLTLNLWDCGGQDRLMEHYFTTQREIIFKNVEVLIYVFDIDQKEDLVSLDMKDYKTTIENLQVYSKNANIFILIHKMDKIKSSERESVFNKKKAEIEKISEETIKITKVFATSIWDETLYKAWSDIVQLLIPNMKFIKDSLSQFCSICGCDEIVLFEKSTFLIIAYHESKPHKDILKYERISNIVKQFKLSCNKISTQINQISVKNNSFSSTIVKFTENTYLMVVFSDPKIQSSAIEFNIEGAKKLFQKNSQKDEMENLKTKW